jgi:hypothetical protein
MIQDTKVIDFGNGWLKFMQSGSPVVIPAAIAPVFDAVKFRECPVFTYIGGSSGVVINGSQWIAGLDALDFAPTDVIRVGDVPKSDGKARYALQQLAAIVPPVDQRLSIMCSVPDQEKQGRQLQNALVGEHHLTRDGKPFTLTIDDVDVRAEGFGAIYYAIRYGLAPSDRINVGLDIGRQTAIVSAFNTRGKEIDTMRVVIDNGGCQSLYQRIGTHSEIVRAFNGQVSADDIESAIQASPHSPQLDGFQFEAIYRAVKNIWLSHILERARTAIGEVYPRVGKVVVFGGGANLVLADLGKLSKFVVLSNAQTATIEGSQLVIDKKIGSAAMLVAR